MKRAFLILSLLLAAAALLYFSLRSFSPGQSKTTPGSSSSSADLTQQFLALEATESQHDQTTWALEMQALVHEMVFVRLWDELRVAEDPWQPLLAFPFGSVRLASNLVSKAGLQHDIQQYFYSVPGETLDARAFQVRVQEWKSAGWKLEQSEFRHPRFVLTNGVPVSTFNFTFHASREAASERVILRGQFNVRWQVQNEQPFPELISVEKLEVLKRVGLPPFSSIFSEVLPPVPGLEALDPYLLVYDLTGDSLPEIALATHNALLKFANGEFTPERLCEHPRQYTHAGVFGDFNGDGQTDFLAADLEGLWLYTRDGTVNFVGEPQAAWRVPGQMFNPFVLTTGDIDADGDLDVWLAQYKQPYIDGQMPTPYYDANDGFPSYLLVNDGHGKFSDRTEASGLAQKRFRRSYSSSFVDLDADADLDLIVVSDFAGLDIHLNDGSGNFRDATAKLVPNPHAFGMAHSLADFNQDGALDILMIGMDSAVADRLDSLKVGRSDFPSHQQLRPAMAHGNRLLLRDGERFIETTLSRQIAKAGWAWGVTAFDFDNDTGLDIYIVNGHNSRASAADYESQFWRHDIYLGQSGNDPVRDMFFRANATKIYGAGLSYGGYHLNRFYLNQGGTNYVEAAYLFGLSLQEDCRNLVSADLDGDGRQELILTTFQQWPVRQQALHIFKNNAAALNWSKIIPANASPGTTLTMQLPSGRKERTVLVTGDSYRSQSPAWFHLGLGDASSIKGVVQNRTASRSEFSANHQQVIHLK